MLNEQPPMESEEFAEVESGLYVSTHLGDVSLARVLWLQGRSILEGARPTSPSEALLAPLRKGLRLVRMLRARKYASVKASGLGGTMVAPSRTTRDQTGSIIQAPEVVMVARDGSRREFYLRSGTVVTHLPEHKARPLVEAVLVRRQAVPPSLAPKVYEASAAEGWYVEEYINGPHARSFHTSAAERRLVLFPILAELRSSSRPDEVDVRDYAARLLHAVSNWTPPGTTAGNAEDGDLLRELRLFARQVSQLLPDDRHVMVKLTLSHGDLTARNVVFDERGPKLIDWGSVGMRSQWHDLLAVHFIGAYVDRYISGSGRTDHLWDHIRVDVLALVSHISNTLGACVDNIAPETSELRWIRHLFYLEVLALQVETYGDLPVPQRGTRRTLDILVNWVRLFRYVEGHLCGE